MEFRQLKYFLAVADSRSFISAASSLYISRQAISKAISQLEEELNVELFMRNSNGAFLTPAGVLFYDRIRNIVTDLEDVRDEIRLYQSRCQQRMRILFAVGTVQLYEQLLLDFQSGQADVIIEYQETTEEKALSMLTEHKAEVVICTHKPTDSQYVTEELFRSPYGILLFNREGISEMEEVEFSDLKWLPLAGIADQQSQDFCEAHGLRLQYVGYDYLRLISLTTSERCALLIPKCLVPPGREDLVWLPLEIPQWWSVYQVHLQQMERNILYRTALDELQYNVFCDFEEGK